MSFNFFLQITVKAPSSTKVKHAVTTNAVIDAVLVVAWPYCKSTKVNCPQRKVVAYTRKPANQPYFVPLA